MEVGPLVCPSHRAELHVEEGGGGLDPSWWKVSGSWDGGERRMRYGKIIDDRPSSNPGAVQRRKLEMLETHAPGASMRVVHSQSHASWVQDPSASGMNTSISSSRRSVLSSSSSTRVTSFRQWSTNFTQNSANSIGVTQEAVPMITEFGNLQLALNPLDVSFLRTKGNVGRSGSIGSRRPPSRGRRLSTDLPSDSSAGEDHSKTPSPIPKGEGIVRTHNMTNENHTYKVEENEKEVTESKSEWTSSKPVLDADEKSKFTLRLQNVLYRKKSVSSEDIRTGEATEEEVESLEDVEGKWRRGESVRRSLPSSEWKSVTTAVDHSRQRLRSRDPFKSSSVPALGGIASRRESLITAESLQEMKGRLKHRGDGTDSTSKPSKTDSQKTQGEDDDSAKPGPFFLRAASRIVLPETKQLQETLDDRRKSWSVGCKNLGKCIFEEESEGMSNRRRSYAFEFAAEEKSSMEDKENNTGETTMQKSTGNSQKGKLWVDTHPYVQNRVNEVLKKWSAISKEEENKGKEELSRTPRKSLMSSRSVFDERKADNMVKSSTTWLENGDFQPNSEDIQEAEFSQAKTSSGGKTSFMVNAPKSPYKEEMIASSQEKQESSFSVYGDPMEDYISAHGLKPIDWTDRDNKASNEPVKNEVMPASSGISVTFSNTDGENNSRHHYSVTHLENREAETTKMDGSKVRTSKKVEFSKTEVHFAAESGRFHIVETAGKPPPSNNFRRRRRSPTGAMNVDSSRVGMGSQSVTNAMRFGDSPYEMRLLAGSENIDHSFRDNGNEFSNGEGDREVKGIDGKGSSESKLTPSNNMKTFNELVMEEEQDMENIVRKISETENSMLTSTNFLHLGPEEQSEKPRSILRNSTSENVPPWKISVKGLDESETEDSKPKFGGVRLRPVASSIGHLRVSITNNESPEQLSTATIEKDYSCSLSPGQMELQKLLRSLRHVSLTYNDGSTDSNSMDAQVANGGGMEVRISSSSGQSPTTNAILISGESSETSTPLSVAQRVREVEERRQKEMMDKVAAIQKPAPRPSGQFSTRVTLGSTTSSVVAVESQVQRKTSVSQIENMNPVSPKPAKKISMQNNKIARIHNAQDKVEQLQVVRKGIHEEICRQERTQYRVLEDGALNPEPSTTTPIIPYHRGRNALSPTSIHVEQPSHLRKHWKKSSSEAEGSRRGNWPNPTPSASWPSARGFGRVSDDRVMLKSPSLILQTMLNTAFPMHDRENQIRSRVPRVMEIYKKTESKVVINKVERIAGESGSETIMSGDKLQPKLSILRALYRDASEEEGSDAPIYEEIKPLDGFQRMRGARVGDGGSVVSGSWRRLRRSKLPPKRASEEMTTSSSVPKPIPRRQVGQAVTREKQRPNTAVEEPPMPPPRNRNNAQRLKRRSDGRGRCGGVGVAGERKERALEKKKREGSRQGGECGGKGIAPRLSSDGQQHSEVAASSDIEISSHLSENYNKMVQSKEVPNVTCISLGFQDEIKEGLKNGEIKDEVKQKSESSSNFRSNINGLSIPNTNRITAKVAEKNIEGRDKSPEGRLYSRTDKYSVTPSSKDVSSAWRQVGTKNKEQDDCTKVDSFPQDIGSLKKGKELKLEMKDKMNENSKIVSLGSLTPTDKSFQSDQTSIQRFKDENRFKDMTGQFSIKMKVVKSQAEGKSGTVLDPTFQSNIKSSIQAEQRKTNISNTLSKFSGNESITQRNKRESSPGVSRELKTIAMQASKSPIMEQRNKVSARSSKSDNPDTASPTIGKVVRKRLRKRGNGSSSKSGSSSDGRKQSKDDESAILEELTKAADEILYAVNGYSDEVSSDEDVEASKTESRTKRRQVSRKEICSKKLSSSSGKDSKSGGSLRNSTQRIKEHRSRVTNGVKSSAEVMQRIIPETQGIDKTNLGSPVSSPSIPACNSRPMVSEKNTKSKQHPPLSICKKIMTRIEPTNRVAEVKLIEKRPPLPPAGQRRPSRNKERSEVLGKGSHGKVKTTTSLVYNKDGEAEVIEELKRPLNIARALEAVMPESRSKTKMIDQKVEVSCALKGSEIQKKLNPTSASSSAQSSPSATLSIDRKKVSSSRDGGKTPRRRAHQTITST